MKRKQYDWHLPDEIKKRLGETSYGRQRAIYEAQHLLLILHNPPSADHHRRDAVVFLRTPDGVYQCNGRPDGKKFLVNLIASYQQLFEKFDKAYDDAQEAEDLFDVLEAISPVARAAANMRNALEAARQHVREDSFLIEMRDHAYDVARSLELLLADARMALDYRIARHTEAQTAQAEETAAAQHKLNILVAMTFPLMAVATLMGMNLHHGLEDQSPAFFWSVLATALVIGLLTRTWVIKGRFARTRTVERNKSGERKRP